MQNFRTLGLIIKKVRDLFNLSDKYGKIIRCDKKVYICKEIFSVEKLIHSPSSLILFHCLKSLCFANS